MKKSYIFQTSLQVTAGQVARLRCESRGGNPPAGLKWFIGDQELPGSSQKNETEVGDNRKWNAVSVIEIAFNRVSYFFIVDALGNTIFSEF